MEALAAATSSLLPAKEAIAPKEGVGLAEKLEPPVNWNLGLTADLGVCKYC